MSKTSTAAVLLGRLGGKARAKALTAEQASEISRKALRARWGDRPRCPCGAMTVARAKARGHKCVGG